MCRAIKQSTPLLIVVVVIVPTTKMSTATVVKMPSPPVSPVRVEPSGEDLAKPYVVNKAVRKTKCRGSKKTCPNSNQIDKGELRLGTRADVDGRPQVFWRHVGCVTKRMLTNKGVTPETLCVFVDFCTNDGSKMSITDEETQEATGILCDLLGAGTSTGIPTGGAPNAAPSDTATGETPTAAFTATATTSGTKHETDATVATTEEPDGKKHRTK